MSNNIVYDAAAHPIHDVTIYMSNQAQITRHINVNLKKGDNSIEVINLPKSLINYSIRVDGIGDVVIRDIVYHPPSARKSRFERVSSREIDALERERAQIDQELAIINTQSTVLQDYITSVSRKTTATDELPDVLRVFADEKRAIANRTGELYEQTRVIDDEISKVKREIRSNDTSDRASVIISVFAKVNGRVDLSFIYTVNNASWYPQYDLYVDIDGPDTKDGSECRARLNYQAVVSQSSGEDWSKVQLKLSTASPQYNSIIPALTKQSLVDRKGAYRPQSSYPVLPVPVPFDSGVTAWDQPYIPRLPSPIPSPVPFFPASTRDRRSHSPSPIREARALHARSRSRSRSRSTSSSRSRSPNRIFVNQVDFSPITIPPPGFVQHSQANVTQHASGFNTVFSLDNPATVLSVAENSVTHNIGLAVLELPQAHLEREAVLKGYVSVYLKCKMKNTSDYTLMPGDVNVFMNNSLVASEYISRVNPQESFTCPLGVDPNVDIILHPQVEEMNGPGGIFGSKSIKTTKSRSVTVKNFGGCTIERLVLRDQVPVTNDRKVNIRVISPAGLPKIKERSLKTVSVEDDKVSARWSPLNKNYDENKYANGEGFIDWICRVRAGETLDFTLCWEVKAPKKLKWDIIG